ncbi:MAG: response regulator [Proteobacteria bacterium]|nr:response regulator [Pseudomonadota bacterium]
MTFRVLIADDSRFARNRVKKGLMWLDVAIEEASTGTEALAACRSFVPHLILLDLNMPEMTGYEVMEALAGDATPPIIVVISAQIQPVAMQRARTLGARAFMQKPLSPAKIESMVANLCAQHAAADQNNGTPAGPTKSSTYTSDELDALGELVNVGMGRAVAALADLLGEFVDLSVPRVDYLPAIVKRWNKQTRDHLVVSQQAFFGDVQGEVVTMYRSADIQKLRALLDAETAEGEDNEIALDVTNILNGACLGSLARQLSARIQYCRPSLIARDISIEELGRRWSEYDEHLAIEISVQINAREFIGDVLVILPPAVEERVRDAVAELMAA